MLVDYLLFRLNELGGAHLYVDRFGGPPTDDITELLNRVSQRAGMLSKGGIPDFPAAAQHFLKMFRLGKLGQFVFDDISREGFKNFFEYLDLSHKLAPSKNKPGEAPTASSVGNYQILPSKQMALRAKRQARLEKIRLKRLSMPAPKF